MLNVRISIVTVCICILLPKTHQGRSVLDDEEYKEHIEDVAEIGWVRNNVNDYIDAVQHEHGSNVQGTPVVRELGHDVRLEDPAHVHDRMVEELGYFIDVRNHVKPKVFIHDFSSSEELAEEYDPLYYSNDWKIEYEDKIQDLSKVDVPLVKTVEGVAALPELTGKPGLAEETIPEVYDDSIQLAGNKTDEGKPKEQIPTVYIDADPKPTEGKPSEDSKPAENTESKPSDYSNAPKPSEYTESKPSEYSEETKSTEYSEDPKPVEYTEDLKPMEYTEDLKPMEYTEDLKPMEYSKPEDAVLASDQESTEYTESQKSTDSSEGVGFIGSILNIFGGQ